MRAGARIPPSVRGSTPRTLNKSSVHKTEKMTRIARASSNAYPPGHSVLDYSNSTGIKWEHRFAPNPSASSSSMPQSTEAYSSTESATPTPAVRFMPANFGRAGTRVYERAGPSLKPTPCPICGRKSRTTSGWLADLKIHIGKVHKQCKYEDVLIYLRKRSDLQNNI